MNIQEYISSGVLELYVAGMLPEEESREVTAMIEQYPELRDEVDEIEKSLGEYAKSYQSDGPGIQVLHQALAQIEEEEAKQAEVSSKGTMLDSAYEPRPQSTSPARYFAWVAGILLILSLAANIYQYRLTRNTQARVESLIQTNQQMESNLNQTQSVLALYEDPSYNRITLEGQPISPTSSAWVYWNSNTSQLYLRINNLPKPPQESQYQLWAIQDGQPVDAGIFDLKNGPLELKDISGKVEAFAITLEPIGGSESPTLEQLYVLGNVSG